GNSARFWKKIEAPDPFLPPKKTKPKMDHRTVYAAGRFVRLAADAPQPPPQPRPPPQARRPAQVHTPDKRVAPNPMPQPEPEPEPEEALPVRGRRPPMPAPPVKRPKSGRIPTRRHTRRGKLVQGGPPPGGFVPLVKDAAPHQQAQRPALADEGEKVPDLHPSRFADSEKPPPPKLRNLDNVLNLLGSLKAAEEQSEYEADLKKQGLLPPKPPPQPKPSPPAKPRQEAKPKPRQQPSPRQEPPTGQRQPPRRPPPKPKEEPKPDKYTPPALRGKDNVMALLGKLQQQEEQFEFEKAQKDMGLPSDKDLFGDDDGWKPPPKPKRMAKPSRQNAPQPKATAPKPSSPPKPKRMAPSTRKPPTPQPKPAPKPPAAAKPKPRPPSPEDTSYIAPDAPRLNQAVGGGKALVGNAAVPRRRAAPEPVEESPPPKKTSGPIRRSIPKGGGGGLDDLFSAPSEGRVRMGRRKPKPKPEE
ncbi:MAG: hypothetical protein HN348_23895, partial [Proteobacteria bacterium]|nr:hypothetical protein [Pseudomonadota bacterium]